MALAPDEGGEPSFSSATGADTDIVFRLTSSRPRRRKVCHEIHSTQLIDALNIPYDPFRQLIAATYDLHYHRDISVYADNFRTISPCLCLSWQARKIGTKACSAAIAFYEQQIPDVTQINDEWLETRASMAQQVAVAQWAAYDSIREQTGAVTDTHDHSDPQTPVDEYAEGHVQPWMTQKIINAVKDAVLATFSNKDNGELMEFQKSSYESLFFEKLELFDDRSETARFPCLCKEDYVAFAAKEAIHAVHYRVEVGVIFALAEDNDFVRTKAKASEFIADAGKKVLRDIYQEGDEQNDCKKDDETHIKEWMQWHAEWSCNNAEREFRHMMSRDPLREDNKMRSQREYLTTQAQKEERIKSLGGLEKARKIDAIDDVSDSIRYTHYPSDSSMPYPGCECLLWGSSKMRCEAWNEAMVSLNGVCLVACDWGDYLFAKVEEAETKAFEEIRGKVLASCPELENVFDPGDHFPEWQQSIVKSAITDAADQAKEVILINKGTPGEKARAACLEAEKEAFEVRKAARLAQGEVIVDDESPTNESTIWVREFELRAYE